MLGDKGIKVTIVVLAAVLIAISLATTVIVGVLSYQGQEQSWFGQSERVTAKVQFDHALEAIEDSFLLGIYWGIRESGSDWEDASESLEEEIEEKIDDYLTKLEGFYRGEYDTQPFRLETMIQINDVDIEVDLDEDEETIDRVELSGNLTSYRNQPSITISDDFYFSENFNEDYSDLYDMARNPLENM